ncbi:MAG: hypothetical protein R3D55_07960 [Chloroflexota bacterium]
MSPNNDTQIQPNEIPEPLPLPDEQAQVFDALQLNLADTAGLATDIEMVIREHLRTAVSPDTFFKIISGLELYLDENTVFYLLEALRRSNETLEMEAIKAHCSGQFWLWLRQLIALYAVDFRKAYAMAVENPHAWDKLNRFTYYDPLNKTWKLSLEIVKYNGDKLTLEETPASAIALVYGLVDMFMNVSPNDAPEQINRDYLANLYLRQLLGLYAYRPAGRISSSPK